MPDTATIVPLPREDGHIIHDARFGDAWLVEIVYNSDPDGESVDDDDDSNRTLHGPFVDLVEAKEWMDSYPDDTDVRDMRAILINSVR